MAAEKSTLNHGQSLLYNCFFVFFFLLIFLILDIDTIYECTYVSFGRHQHLFTSKNVENCVNTIQFGWFRLRYECTIYNAIAKHLITTHMWMPSGKLP